MSRTGKKRVWSWCWPASLVFLAALAVSAAVIWQLEQHRLLRDRAYLNHLASEHAHALQGHIQRTLLVTHTIAALVRQGHGTMADFQSVASDLLTEYPDVAALSLSPGGILREVVPLAGNEASIGFDPLSHPEQQREALLARDTGRLTLAGPLQLVQGGLGLVGRLPVFLDNAGQKTFWGFVNVVLRLPQALAAGHLSYLRELGVDYQLWRLRPGSNERQIIAASADVLDEPVEHGLDAPNATWTLSVAPMTGWWQPQMLIVQGLLGLSFSVLLAYIALLLQQARRHSQALEGLVAARTAEILATRNHLQATLDAIPDLLFEMDLDGRYHSHHCSRDELLAAPAGTFIGQRVTDVLPSEAASVVLEALHEAHTHGYAQGRQLELTLAQGQAWFELSVSPKGAVPGQSPRFIVLSRDITRRKRVEAALRDSEALYQSLVNAIPQNLYRIDDQGRLIFVNKALSTLLGQPVPALLGRSLWDFYPEHLAEIYRVGDADIMRSGQTCSTVEDFVLPGTDQLRHMEVVKVPICNSSGVVVGLQGMFWDVTERIRMAERLAVAATAFESQEGMLVTDAGQRILQVNRAYTSITGYTADDSIGRRPSLLSSGRHDAAFFATVWASINSSGSWQGEIWNRRKNGQVYPAWITITAVRGEHGDVTHYVGSLTDITTIKAAEDEIRRLAFFDPLTHLPNRRLLIDRLQHALANSSRHRREGALLFIDLDNFKTLNDTCGHDAGDLLLQQVAGRLTASVRQGDTVARLGGDEFVVMLEGIGDRHSDAMAQATVVGEKILAALNQPYILAGQEHRSTPSIGVTLFGGQRTSVEELLKRADIAMYQAKAAGRNAIRFFDPTMQMAIAERNGMEAELREGIQAGQLLLHYQPQIDAEGRCRAVEALVRWQHPRHGLLLPDDFLPLAIEAGVMPMLELWVLNQACRQLAAWAEVPAMQDSRVAVNISAQQFRHPGFVRQVTAVLQETGIRPAQLWFELTEQVLAESLGEVLEKMQALKALGVGLVFDDFGTGGASFADLKRLPLDQVKIDPSFVHATPDDAAAAGVVQSIVMLAQHFGWSVIAECVETSEQREVMMLYGCDAGQGFWLGRPCVAAELVALLQAAVQA